MLLKRLAACQILSYADPGKSADKVVHWMGQAAATGVDAVACPQACLCGYCCDEIYWRTADCRAFVDAEARVRLLRDWMQRGVALVERSA